MMGGIPPDPYSWKIDTERHAELVRSGKATNGGIGVIVDVFMVACGWVFSRIARLWRKRG